VAVADFVIVVLIHGVEVSQLMGEEEGRMGSGCYWKGGQGIMDA
jgi:hypothetical protein